MTTNDNDQSLPHDLPVLTEVVSEDDLPTLNDIVEVPELEAPDQPFVTEPQRLPETMPLAPPPHLEAHLEDLFMQRLLPRLEAAQRQAVAQTWDELKHELPELVRSLLPPRA